MNTSVCLKQVREILIMSEICLRYYITHFFINDYLYFLVSVKMTRYARAKGSKASNERVPNEATPWHLMKQQLGEDKNKKDLKYKKSAKELLMDRQNSDAVKTSNHDWAEFDDKFKNLKSKHYTKLTESSRNDETTHDVIVKSNNIGKLEKTKNRKIEKTDKKNNKFSNKEKQNINDTYTHSESDKKESNTLESNKSSNFPVLTKRQKRNLKRKLEKSSNNESKRFKKDISNGNSESEVKEKRIKNSEYKRKKPDTGVQTIIINGVETEIVKYDGFPVKKEDAERLAKLKQELLLKGKYNKNSIKFCVCSNSILTLNFKNW